VKSMKAADRRYLRAATTEARAELVHLAAI
jgi:hypothetical protein